MPLGMNGISNILIPSAWDAGELARLQLRDGTTYQQIIGDIDSALTIINGQLTSGYLGRLIAQTEEAAVEYRNGSSNGFEDETEYTTPDAKRADTTGHMLPLRGVDRKLGWTNRWFEECRRAQIDADIASLIDDVRNVWEQRTLTRLFKSGEESGRAYGLGASGISVPLANGNVVSIGGAASVVVYTPVPYPQRAASAFASSHSHYLRLNGITQANLETAVQTVWEHGHDGPYELIISLADLASWADTTAVTGYSRKISTLIQYGTTTQLSTVDQEYVAAVETKYGPCQVWASGRLPTKYWGVFKSYGPLDQRNPLKVRSDPLFGFGVKLVVDRVGMYPLAEALGRMRFGVGVGEDRTNGVCAYNAASGTYTDPAIA